MNTYQVLYILKPDMEDEARTAVIEQIAGIITADGGEVVKTDEWGMRRLAYPIQDLNDGYYVLVDFKAKPELPRELERKMQISEQVMRYMVEKQEA